MRYGQSDKGGMQRGSREQNFAVFPAAAAGRLGEMRIGFWTDTGNQASGQPASQGVLRQRTHTAVSVWRAGDGGSISVSVP